eukprot:maker-scaffold389_size186684-snap-gene-0.22 protein:Tk00870 transcript:maker-scaffold389_size186684-snap-gene-0.22-mRNA-1 annotation:"fk506-binding protein"
MNMKHSNLIQLWAEYKLLRNRSTNAIRRDRRRHVQDIAEQHPKDTRMLWDLLSGLSKVADHNIALLLDIFFPWTHPKMFLLCSVILLASLAHGLKEEITFKTDSSPDYCPFSVELGDTLKIQVTSARLDHPLKGDTFDKTLTKNPRTFVYGSANIIPGLSSGLHGMCVDEVRTVKIPNIERYFKDVTSQIAVGDKAKHVYYTLELLELTKGESIKAFSSGLSFGSGDL